MREMRRSLAIAVIPASETGLAVRYAARVGGVEKCRNKSWPTEVTNRAVPASCRTRLARSVSHALNRELCRGRGR